MKQTLNLMDMESLNGGNKVDNFCLGFGAVSTAYAIGVAANWWNPIGWGGTVTGLVIAGGCAAYSLR